MGGNLSPGGESGKLTEPRGTWSSVCTHLGGWENEEQAHVFTSISQKEKQFLLECPGGQPTTEAWSWMPHSRCGASEAQFKWKDISIIEGERLGPEIGNNVLSLNALVMISFQQYASRKNLIHSSRSIA